MMNWLHSPGAGGQQNLEAELQLAQGMVEALTNNATVAFIVCDMDHTVIYVNGTFESVFGWSATEAIGRKLPTVSEEAWSAFQEKLQGRSWKFMDDETLKWRKDGSSFSASETISPIKDSSGAIISYACIVRDISTRKQAERKLKESEQRFKSLFEQNSDATLSLDLEGRMTGLNPAAQLMTGHAYPEPLDRPLIDLIVPEERKAFERRFLQAKLSGVEPFDSALHDRQGNRVELNIKLLPIVIDQETVGIYCIAKDVTAHKQALDTIHYMAFYDALTELPNRRLFQERLQAELTSGQRFGVVWIDLDGFKHINDTYGHAAGDYVLQEIGIKLKRAVRGEDVVARMGGDEFTVLVSAVSDPTDITEFAERLVRELGTPLAYQGHSLHVTPSIGIAIRPQDGSDVDTLLIHADKAMYEVKESGKNGYCLYGRPASRLKA